MLQQCFSKHLENIDDPRVQGRCNHSLHDAFVAAFACMYFQDPSLAHFQRRLQETENISNLKTLFGVTSTPKESQLRSILDDMDSECLRPVFKDYAERVRRGKHLESFQILPGQYLCAIDGVYYHTSHHIHCEKCLSKTHKNGTVSYHHAALQGALMHPDKRQVMPTMPEPIANTDGAEKQDCEINAAKRYLSKLKADHPRMGIIITDDGLFSKTPMIAHTLAKAGRCRWKIENECFNTLKNQGYHLEHNFGHGKQHLSHTMYLLTRLAFFYHQTFELTDPAYQLCRKAMGSKRMLWETFRVLIRYFIFDTWNDLMRKLMSGRGGIPCLENEA